MFNFLSNMWITLILYTTEIFSFLGQKLKFEFVEIA